jgi:hypothetical protein
MQEFLFRIIEKPPFTSQVLGEAGRVVYWACFVTMNSVVGRTRVDATPCPTQRSRQTRGTSHRLTLISGGQLPSAPFPHTASIVKATRRA